MSMKRITLITFGLSLASLTACSSSLELSPPTPADYDDTAQAIAAATAAGHSGTVGSGEIVAMADAVSLARGSLPAGFLRGVDGRVRGEHFGVEYSFAITCKDAAGVELAACGRTTDSATVEVTLSGQLDTPNLTAVVDRQGTWSITGLQGATATFSGDSSLSFDTTLTSVFREGVTASFTFDATASFDAIQIDTADRAITGGSASFDVAARRTVSGTNNDVDRAFEISAELTFNGDGSATLVLDGSQSFTLDLGTGRVARSR
jgi:hypothetical protein